MITTTETASLSEIRIVALSSGRARDGCSHPALLENSAERKIMPGQNSTGLGPQAKTSNTVSFVQQSATSKSKGIRPISAAIPSISGKKESSANMPTRNDDMSNDIGAIPQQQEYSYPPLGELGMNDAVQPYGNLPEHREFTHMSEERNPYDDQHQLQHQQQEPMGVDPRYQQQPAQSPPSGDQYVHNNAALERMHAQTAQLVNELQNALSARDNIDDASGSQKDPESPGRSKPVPKPDRPVTKDTDGRFVCNWPGCEEAVKHFNRKCEWSKHMDKHDRPYKCPAVGCEKLPGFTYSGGLLRHEREVHNKHGGPRKQLNCPHQNCKRHIGKGFSRQENLNEHLRRVHTDSPAPPQPATMNGATETEPEGPSEATGAKRKRRSIGNSGASPEDDELREEVKRMKIENDGLRQALAELSMQFRAMQNAYAGTVHMQHAQQQHQLQQVQQPVQPQAQPQQMSPPQMQHAQMQAPQMQAAQMQTAQMQQPMQQPMPQPIQQPIQQQMQSPIAKFEPSPQQQAQQQQQQQQMQQAQQQAAQQQQQQQMQQAQQVLQQQHQQQQLQQQQAQQASAQQNMQRMPPAPMI